MTSLEDPNGQAQATYFQESVSTTGNSTPTVTQSNDPQHHHHHHHQQQQQHHHHHVGSYYQDSPSSTYTYEVEGDYLENHPNVTPHQQNKEQEQCQHMLIMIIFMEE